jgi:hypothetical protein
MNLQKREEEEEEEGEAGQGAATEREEGLAGLHGTTEERARLGPGLGYIVASCLCASDSKEERQPERDCIS